MEPLEGIYIQQVACGLGHTLFIARDEESDRPLLDKIPVYDPDKVTIVLKELLHGLRILKSLAYIFQVRLL